MGKICFTLQMQKRSKHPAYRRRRKPAFFRPVPVKAREDGWTTARQALFLAELYLTGTVTAAARRVGMTRMSAYRLRARGDAASFARAWDSVLSPPGTGKLPPAQTNMNKVTQRELIWRIEEGFLKPVLYRAKTVQIRRKPDNNAIFQLLRQSDGNRARGGRGLGDGGRGVGANSRCILLQNPRLTGPCLPPDKGRTARLNQAPPAPHMQGQRPPWPRSANRRGPALAS